MGVLNGFSIRAVDALKRAKLLVAHFGESRMERQNFWLLNTHMVSCLY